MFWGNSFCGISFFLVSDFEIGVSKLAQEPKKLYFLNQKRRFSKTCIGSIWKLEFYAIPVLGIYIYIYMYILFCFVVFLLVLSKTLFPNFKSCAAPLSGMTKLYTVFRWHADATYLHSISDFSPTIFYTFRWEKLFQWFQTLPLLL